MELDRNRVRYAYDISIIGNNSLEINKLRLRTMYVSSACRRTPSRGRCCLVPVKPINRTRYNWKVYVRAVIQSLFANPFLSVHCER